MGFIELTICENNMKWAGLLPKCNYSRLSGLTILYFVSEYGLKVVLLVASVLFCGFKPVLIG
jgi:hypothetical protein